MFDRPARMRRPVSHVKPMAFQEFKKSNFAKITALLSREEYFNEKSDHCMTQRRKGKHIYCRVATLCDGNATIYVYKQTFINLYLA